MQADRIRGYAECGSGMACMSRDGEGGSAEGDGPVDAVTARRTSRQRPGERTRQRRAIVMATEPNGGSPDQDAAPTRVPVWGPRLDSKETRSTTLRGLGRRDTCAARGRTTPR
jgi:hypothetical protein